MRRRCFGGMRRQMSIAVRTTPTGPNLRVNKRRRRGTENGSYSSGRRSTLASSARPRYHPPPPSQRDLPPQGGPMPVETPSVFANVIQEHLELKRRNSELD